jgi:hypothetical protein
MFPFRPWPPLLRSLTLALLFGACLLPAAPVAAQAQQSCAAFFEDDSGFHLVMTAADSGADAGPRVRLVLATNDEGVPRVRGIIRLTDESPPVILLAATREAAEVRCADADGDGTSGLVSLTATFREVAVAAPEPPDREHAALVAVTVTVTGDQDIDASGTYPVTLRIAENGQAITLTTEVAVRLGPGPIDLDVAEHR